LIQESVFGQRESSRGWPIVSGSILKTNMDQLTIDQPQGFGATQNRFLSQLVSIQQFQKLILGLVKVSPEFTGLKRETDAIFWPTIACNFSRLASCEI